MVKVKELSDDQIQKMYLKYKKNIKDNSADENCKKKFRVLENELKKEKI